MSLKAPHIPWNILKFQLILLVSCYLCGFTHFMLLLLVLPSSSLTVFIPGFLSPNAPQNEVFGRGVSYSTYGR